VATWKRLSCSDGQVAYVNIEQIAYMRCFDNYTRLTFAITKSDVEVTETPEQIMETPRIGSS
jgi:hypothetical protein